MNPGAVACVVLNWNGGDEICRCLQSVQDMRPGPDVTILVDNDSTDGSVDLVQSRFPDVQIVRNPSNLGFAGGVNTGIRAALAQGVEFVWLLNPDALAPPGLLTDLLATAAEDAEVGIVGAILVEADTKESIQAWGGGRVNLWTGMSRHLLLPDEELHYMTGACLLVRSAVLEQIGLFNDDYFFYWEDVEFSFRARDAGWKLAVAEQFRVRHVEASSLGRFSEARAYRLFEGLVRFMRSQAPIPLLAVMLRLAHQTLWCLYRGYFPALRGAYRGAWAGWRGNPRSRR